MTLATSNSQGELSPLEVGMHALHVDFDKRGRGARGGGLKEYAAEIGKSASKVSEYRAGAKVVECINSHVGINELLTKAAHLAEISKLPESCWPVAVDAKQANDTQLIEWATEIRVRAERRAGEMLAAQKEAGLMAKGTKGVIQPGMDGAGGKRDVPPADASTLADIGAECGINRCHQYRACTSEGCRLCPHITVGHKYSLSPMSAQPASIPAAMVSGH